jgi:hypothetical protein
VGTILHQSSKITKFTSPNLRCYPILWQKIYHYDPETISSLFHNIPLSQGLRFTGRIWIQPDPASKKNRQNLAVGHGSGCSTGRVCASTSDGCVLAALHENCWQLSPTWNMFLWSAKIPKGPGYQQAVQLVLAQGGAPMRLLGPRDPKNKPKIRSLSRLKSPAAAASQSPVKRGKSMPSAPLHNGEPPASFVTGKNSKIQTS